MVPTISTQLTSVVHIISHRVLQMLNIYCILIPHCKLNTYCLYSFILLFIMFTVYVYINYLMFTIIFRYEKMKKKNIMLFRFYVKLSMVYNWLNTSHYPDTRIHVYSKH